MIIRSLYVQARQAELKDESILFHETCKESSVGGCEKWSHKDTQDKWTWAVFQLQYGMELDSAENGAKGQKLGL